MAVEEKKKIVGGLVNKKPASQLKEQKREDDAWKKKLFGYLEGFKKSFESLTSGKKVKGEGLFGKLFGGLAGGLKGWISKLFPAGLLAAIPALFFGSISKLGIAALIVGGIVALTLRIRDGFEGWAKAEAGEWGSVDKISAWIGAFLGGTGRGLWNALKVGGTWAIVGMTAGMAFGPPGMIIGAIIGGVIGGLLGWVGGQKIAEWVDGTVNLFRNIFNVPELLSDEQKEEAKKAKDKAKTDLMKLQMQQGAWLRELEASDTSWQRRIELRRKLAVAEDQIEQKKDIIATQSRRLAASELAEKNKLLKEQRGEVVDAQNELLMAQQSRDNAWLKAIWARAIHGKDSDEHKAAVALYDDQVLAVADAKKNLEVQVTKRDEIAVDRQNLQNEIDREHRTFMGNIRLYFQGELDWQRNMIAGWENFTQRILPAWFKAHIYDPGGTRIHPDHPEQSKMKILGVELNWPKIKALWPDWGELFRNYIFDPGQAGRGVPGSGSPMRIFGQVISWPKIKALWPDWGKLFKEYIFDKGEGDAPMKIFGAEISFPELNWTKEDIWNALPMWIRDPIQFIKDNLPDVTGAAKEVAADIADAGQQAAAVVGGVELNPFSEGGTTVGDVAGSVASGISTGMDFVGGMWPWGDKGQPEPAAGGETAGDRLRRHEGFSGKAYKDTENISTIGYGFNLEKMGAQRLLNNAGIDATVAELMSGKKTITEAEAKKLMSTDMEQARVDARKFMGLSWKRLPEEVKDVLVNMAYNMGGPRLEGFTKLKAALVRGDYRDAAAEMRDSQWKSQVGDRAVELSKIVEAIGNSEPHMKTDVGLMLKANPSAMGALLRGYGGGGGGTTTVNNVTVAPQTSTSVASTNIAENVYGTVDPYTNAAGAYG